MHAWTFSHNNTDIDKPIRTQTEYARAREQIDGINCGLQARTHRMFGYMVVTCKCHRSRRIIIMGPDKVRKWKLNELNVCKPSGFLSQNCDRKRVCLILSSSVSIECVSDAHFACVMWFHLTALTIYLTIGQSLNSFCSRAFYFHMTFGGCAHDREHDRASSRQPVGNG